MIQSFHPGVTLLLLAGIMLVLGAGCRNSTASVNQAQTTSQAQTTKQAQTTAPTAAPPPVAPPAVSPAPVAKLPNLLTGADPYQLALSKAASAQNIGDYAQSQDDWQLAASQWQQAIQLLRSLPPSHPHRSKAQRTLASYQRSFAYATQQANRMGADSIALNPGTATVRSAGSPNRSASRGGGTTDLPERSGGIYRARITRRLGGTPVIEVTFNGNQTYEMIVDTGASGTVITESMAATLGVQVVGKAKVDTASARDVEVPLAHMASMSAGGVTIKDVVVAIGGPSLEVGLLGHDFFNNYDVTIRQDVVEFRSR